MIKLTLHNRKLRFALLAVLVVLTGLVACKKPGGDYGFVNTENVFDGTDYAYLASKPGVYDSLMKAINRVDWLRDSLSAAGNELTVFAPSNSSFRLIMSTLNIARASQGKAPLYINDLDPNQLDTLLSRYVVHGSITTTAIQFVDGLPLSSVKYDYPMHGQKSYSEATGFQGGGPTNIIFSDTKQSQFVRDWIRSETNVVNIITTNGVVHNLEAEHEIGFGEFISRFNQ